MPAEIVFTHSLMLWGVAAAATPILVHLLLRPRPRRARFPALALLRPALVSGQRANRVRNVLLMLVRSALLALAALLLAAPTCAPAVSDPLGSQPAACAIVLDDSASMGYQPDGAASLLSLARDRAFNFVRQSAAWPEGSTLALLTAGLGDPPSDWTTDRDALVRKLHSVPADATHARPLGRALHAAAALLRAADQPARRLIVFTDGTAHAWRDVTPATLAGIEHLALRVGVPDDAGRTNLAILAAAGPSRLHPADVPIPLHVTIAATGVESDCWLVVQHERRTVQRVGPVHLAADDRHELALELPPLPPGPHALTVQLDPSDHLDFDQRRHFAVQTAPRPHVWLIRPSGEDLSALILRNLLAPELLPAERQLVELREFESDDVPAATTGAPGTRAPPLVILLSDIELSAATRQSLLRRVEDGGSLLLVPRAAAEDADWPGIRSLLCDNVPVDERLANLTTIRWERASPYAAGEGLAELARCAARRRLRLDRLRDEVVVHARYADGQPAIVAKQLGAGRILLLTTTPDPQWSDLGIRAAGLITWLHVLIDEARGPPGAIGAFRVGEQPRQRFADLPVSGLARVSAQRDGSAPPTWVRLSEDPLPQPWPTARPGIYEVRPAGGDEPRATYVVNWPAEESDLTPIALPQLTARVGLEDVGLSAGADDSQRRPASAVGWLLDIRDGRQPLAALLLAAFAFELLLAARYRQAQRRSA